MVTRIFLTEKRRHMYSSNMKHFTLHSLRERGFHLTRPPRLEGAVKNAMMNPVRKKKKLRAYVGRQLELSRR